MYCVIQELELKKPNKRGYSKELISQITYSSILGDYYWHYYSHERFERPIKKAYKISIHQSYRENGKVKKKQYVLCTVNYYDFAADNFTVFDYCESGIKSVSNELGVDEGILYDMIEEKVNPLIESIQDEFMQTEEYRTHDEHEDITTIYAAKKAEFTNTYECEQRVYDTIYDVFGNLMNEKKLEEVKADYKARKEYEEKSRSYQEDYFNNYSKYFSGSGSYFNSNHSNHKSEDKDMFKQFYRVLSKKFHPDANPDRDTSKEMQLLNQLKEQWDI